MAYFYGMFRWYTSSTSPASGITLHSRVLAVSVGNAGFVWQTPTSIETRSGRARIVDVTRITQVALFLTALLVTLRSRA